MAVTFRVPKAQPKSIQTISQFLGVDFTNSPANIDISRSPNAPNMIREVPGKVRKSMGWEVIESYEEGRPINGCHYLRGDSDYFVHTGTKLYHKGNVIYSGMNNYRSKAWQFNNELFIVDGKELIIVYKDGDTYRVKPATQDAYIPTLTISKNPDGGGVSYEDLNLLQPGFTEQFLGKENVKEYSLSFGGLDATEVKVQILNSNGDWVDKKENTDFVVNRETGTVTFNTAPGVSPVTGEDNVKITAYRTVEDYAEKINKCTFGTLYGVNGGNDRLFLSGNPDFVNYDWHSEQYDPTYFADTSYARLGSDSSAIVGYSVISGYLATHKDDMEREQNIIMRVGNTGSDGITIFRVYHTIQGAGAIATNSFAYLTTEPLFLTTQGIFAVTSQDVTGEKYAQNRSFYLNGKLLEESNLTSAYACVFRDMYWLCVNDVCYILDGVQPVDTDRNMPYSTRQYCGFYRTNVPANIMWVKDNRLWFGTHDGRVCRFFDDKGALGSYADDGKPITAIWETPDIDGNLFYKNKTVRHLAIRLGASVATSVKVYAMVRGIWEFVKEDASAGRYLKFSRLMFSRFSFSSDSTQKIVRSKLRIKKVDKFRLRMVNDVVDEQFSLYDIGLEFVENGNYKG